MGESEGEQEQCKSEKQRTLKVLYTNANGLVSKLTELKVLVSENNIDIMCVTETHFSEELVEAELSISGFTAFRGDRDFKLDCSVSGNVSGGWLDIKSDQISLNTE